MLVECVCVRETSDDLVRLPCKRHVHGDVPEPFHRLRRDLPSQLAGAWRIDRDDHRSQIRGIGVRHPRWIPVCAVEEHHLVVPCGAPCEKRFRIRIARERRGDLLSGVRERVRRQFVPVAVGKHPRLCALHVARESRRDQVGALFRVALDKLLRAVLPLTRRAVAKGEQRGNPETDGHREQGNQPTSPRDDRLDFHRDSSRCR